MVQCDICDKELKGIAAREIKFTIGDTTYYKAHLCLDHWMELNTQIRNYLKGGRKDVKFDGLMMKPSAQATRTC